MEQTPKQPPPAGAEGKAQLNIKVNDDVAKGTYANLAIVHNNENEFIFDFVFMEPQRRQGQVVSRVVANPKTVKRMLTGLNELMRIYEERFGKIEAPEVGAVKGTYH